MAASPGIVGTIESLTTPQIATFGFFALLAYLVFIRIWAERRKNVGPEIKDVTRRGIGKVIDPDIKGIIAEIVSKKTLPDGRLQIIFQNEFGITTKIYLLGDIVEFDKSQVLFDPGPPVWITKTAKYSQTEIGEELKESRKNEMKVIKEMDIAKRELKLLQDNFDSRLESQREYDRKAFYQQQVREK